MLEVAAYVSGAQSKHLVAPDGENVPASQLAHAILPGVLVYFPGAHREHIAALFAPSKAEDVPSGQAWQVVAPVATE